MRFVEPVPCFVLSFSSFYFVFSCSLYSAHLPQFSGMEVGKATAQKKMYKIQGKWAHTRCFMAQRFIRLHYVLCIWCELWAPQPTHRQGDEVSDDGVNAVRLVCLAVAYVCHACSAHSIEHPFDSEQLDFHKCSTRAQNCVQFIFAFQRKAHQNDEVIFHFHNTVFGRVIADVECDSRSDQHMRVSRSYEH